MNDEKFSYHINSQGNECIRDNYDDKEYDISDIDEILNQLYMNNIEKNKQIADLFNKIERINVYNIHLISGYAKQYNRDSSEFNLICEIGKDLGVTVSLLEAKDD